MKLAPQVSPGLDSESDTVSEDSEEVRFNKMSDRCLVTKLQFKYLYCTITSFNFIDEVKYFLRQLDGYTFGHDIESVSKDVIFLREVKKSAPIHPISSFDRETSRALSRLDSFKPKLVIADVYKFPERETHLDLPNKKEFERYYERKSQNLR